MRLLVPVAAAVLLGACTSNPSPTPAPATLGPTSSPSPAAVPTVPEPSFSFSVDCGPLDPVDCQAALMAVEARVASQDLASVADVAMQPPASMLSCPPSGDVCIVTAVVTFTEPGPLAIGLALVSDGWSGQGPTKGWWGDQGRFGAVAATYRIGSRIDNVGCCMGGLFDPAGVTITLAVGQAIDLHMTVGGASSRPLYPLPWSTSPAVINVDAASDAADARYRALSPGSAMLTTVGNCVPTANTPNGLGEEFFGPCPVAAIRVR